MADPKYFVHVVITQFQGCIDGILVFSTPQLAKAYVQQECHPNEAKEMEYTLTGDFDVDETALEDSMNANGMTDYYHSIEYGLEIRNYID